MSANLPLRLWLPSALALKRIVEEKRVTEEQARRALYYALQDGEVTARDFFGILPIDYWSNCERLIHVGQNGIEVHRDEFGKWFSSNWPKEKIQRKGKQGPRNPRLDDQIAHATELRRGPNPPSSKSAAARAAIKKLGFSKSASDTAAMRYICKRIR